MLTQPFCRGPTLAQQAAAVFANRLDQSCWGKTRIEPVNEGGWSKRTIPPAAGLQMAPSLLKHPAFRGKKTARGTTKTRNYTLNKHKHRENYILLIHPPFNCLKHPPCTYRTIITHQLAKTSRCWLPFRLLSPKAAALNHNLQSPKLLLENPTPAWSKCCPLPALPLTTHTAACPCSQQHL